MSGVVSENILELRDCDSIRIEDGVDLKVLSKVVLAIVLEKNILIISRQ